MKCEEKKLAIKRVQIIVKFNKNEIYMDIDESIQIAIEEVKENYHKREKVIAQCSIKTYVYLENLIFLLLSFLSLSSRFVANLL